MIESNKTVEISLKELFFKCLCFFQYIFKKWKLILLFSSLGAIIGFTYSLFSDSIYKAEYKFVLKEYRPITLNGTFSSNLGFDLNMKDDSYVYSTENFIDLFKSRKIIQNSLLQTIIINKEKITLADYYLDLYHLYNSHNKIFPIKSEKKHFNRFQLKVLNLIYDRVVNENIDIEKHHINQGIFKVEISSKRENFSINFIESIFKVIIDDFKKMKTININKLEAYLDSIKFRTNLMLSEDQNSKLNSINFNENQFDSNNLSIDYYLNMKLLYKLSEQLEISKLNLLNNSQLIQIIDKSTKPLLDQKVSALFLTLLFGIIFGTFAIILIFSKKTFVEFKLKI